MTPEKELMEKFKKYAEVIRTALNDLGFADMKVEIIEDGEYDFSWGDGPHLAIELGGWWRIYRGLWEVKNGEEKVGMTLGWVAETTTVEYNYPHEPDYYDYATMGKFHTLDNAFKVIVEDAWSQKLESTLMYIDHEENHVIDPPEMMEE